MRNILFALRYFGNMPRIKIFFIILLLIYFSSIFCQDSIQFQPEIKELGDGWFEVSASVIIENITPEEAKNMAIRIACQMAIEQFSGLEVSGRTTLIHAESGNKVELEHFLKLSNQVSQGIILEKQIIDEQIITTNNISRKKITIRVKVGKQEGERDAFFYLDANLNKDYFKEGDEIEIEFTPSKDCYIIILNIMSDENVATLFPNEYRNNNFLKANKTFKLPNADDRQKGIKYIVGLLPNKTEDSEIIKIIATKEPINFLINTDYKTALESLQNWLVTFPRDEIEEVDLQYIIYK